MKYKTIAYLSYLTLGLLTSILIQVFFYLLDYFYDGYWTLPTLGNFAFTSFVSGNFFALFWFAIVRATTETEY